jgi:hypothetical protein
MKTPVLFIIFNRPDTTTQVFQAIRKAKPPKLFVIADGPRLDKIGEAEKCADARKIIAEGVDWECEVSTNYSDINMGCRKRISSGIDWVFEQVEEAIILEDDCLPEPTFFRFCEELLEKYRYDTRIMSVRGGNYASGKRRTTDSYYFSKYTQKSWGWATWRRAWQLFDVDMKLWNQVRDGGWLEDILNDDLAVKVWRRDFQLVYDVDERMDAWDHQWTFVCFIHSGLTIVPNVNLISNLGFGTHATHTRNKADKFANLPTEAMSFPLKHSAFVVCDSKTDKYEQKISNNLLTKLSDFFSKFQDYPSLKKTIRRYIRKALP